MAQHSVSVNPATKATSETRKPWMAHQLEGNKSFFVQKRLLWFSEASLKIKQNFAKLSKFFLHFGVWLLWINSVIYSSCPLFKKYYSLWIKTLCSKKVAIEWFPSTKISVFKLTFMPKYLEIKGYFWNTNILNSFTLPFLLGKSLSCGEKYSLGTLGSYGQSMTPPLSWPHICLKVDFQVLLSNTSHKD